MHRVAIALIVLLACTGAYVSGALLRGHDGAWETGPRNASLVFLPCGEARFDSADCASVIGSRWGSFDFHVGRRRVLIPTSLLGLVHFAAVAIWFAMQGRIPAAARWHWRGTMAYLSCALLASAGLIGLMAFQLPHWCPPCVAAHAINAAIVIAAWWAWRMARREASIARPTPRTALSNTASYAPPPHGRVRLTLCAALAACGAAVAIWMHFDDSVEIRRQWRKLADVRAAVDDMRNDPAFVLREFYAQPVVDIPEHPCRDAEESAAPPRLVIFTDYACTGCRCFESRRASLIDAAFPDGLRVEYRLALIHEPDGPHLPRDPAQAIPGRQADLRASEAARLQGDAAAFEQFHRLLYRSRGDEAARDYARLAERAGLDAPRLLADMDTPEAHARVRDNAALSRQLGVSEAPTLFLDGRRVPPLCINSPVFWSAIARESSQRFSAISESGVLAHTSP